MLGGPSRLGESYIRLNALCLAIPGLAMKVQRKGEENATFQLFAVYPRGWVNPLFHSQQPCQPATASIQVCLDATLWSESSQRLADFGRKR